MDDERRQHLLELFARVRVADVCDALDALGLVDRCSMAPEIRPIWIDREGLRHRMHGFAVTVRYLPTNRPFAPQTPQESARCVEEWNARIWSEGDFPVAPGDVVVIDGAGIRNIGYIGSCNLLRWRAKGAVGVVTNAGCRDTDEIARMRIPVYSAYVGQGRKPGRVEFDAYNRPVCVGGVMVCPGDMVVADGDGVIVVPARCLDAVAELALAEHARDQAARRRLYEECGWPDDGTLG